MKKCINILHLIKINAFESAHYMLFKQKSLKKVKFFDY